MPRFFVCSSEGGKRSRLSMNPDVVIERHKETNINILNAKMIDLSEVLTFILKNSFVYLIIEMKSESTLVKYTIKHNYQN